MILLFSRYRSMETGVFSGARLCASISWGKVKQPLPILLTRFLRLWPLLVLLRRAMSHQLMMWTWEHEQLRNDLEKQETGNQPQSQCSLGHFWRKTAQIWMYLVYPNQNQDSGICPKEKKFQVSLSCLVSIKKINEKLNISPGYTSHQSKTNNHHDYHQGAQ